MFFIHSKETKRCITLATNSQVIESYSKNHPVLLNILNGYLVLKDGSLVTVRESLGLE